MTNPAPSLADRLAQEMETLPLERSSTHPEVTWVRTPHVEALVMRLLQEAHPTWQPIETAPKDGSSFLGFRLGKVEVFRYIDAPSGPYWNCVTAIRLTSSERENLPTLWMPFP